MKPMLLRAVFKLDCLNCNRGPQILPAPWAREAAAEATSARGEDAGSPHLPDRFVSRSLLLGKRGQEFHPSQPEGSSQPQVPCYLPLLFTMCVTTGFSSPSKDAGGVFLICKNFILSSKRDENFSTVR